MTRHTYSHMTRRGAHATVLGGIPEEPERPYNHLTHVPVLDLKGIYSVPFDAEQEGIKSFRAIIFLRNHVTHIENSPGKYITDGEWSAETALNIVYFDEGTTHRTPELLLGFVDHGIADSNSVGFSVESLPLPLLKSGKQYEKKSSYRSLLPPPPPNNNI